MFNTPAKPNPLFYGNNLSNSTDIFISFRDNFTGSCSLRQEIWHFKPLLWTGMTPCLFHPARGSRQAAPVMLHWPWSELSSPAAHDRPQEKHKDNPVFHMLSHPPVQYLLWVSGILPASLQDFTVGFRTLFNWYNNSFNKSFIVVFYNSALTLVNVCFRSWVLIF